MNDDKARAALADIRKLCDENLGPSRSSLLNRIAHLADEVLASRPSSPPASFRRIYEKMQRGKVSADERQEPETNPYVADDGQFGAGA